MSHSMGQTSEHFIPHSAAHFDAQDNSQVDPKVESRPIHQPPLHGNRSRTAWALLLAATMVGCNSSTDSETSDRSSTESSVAADANSKSAPDAAQPTDHKPGSDSVFSDRYSSDPYANLESYAFDFTLPSTTGESVSKASFAGKVLIVDIWATWCGPCRMEVPHFVELQKEYADAGLNIVGINYEGGDNAEADIATIKEFTDEIPVNYPLLLGDAATQDQVPSFVGYPTTVFVDRTGKVRLTLVGAREKAELETVIKTLLEEPTAG